MDITTYCCFITKLGALEVGNNSQFTPNSSKQDTDYGKQKENYKHLNSCQNDNTGSNQAEIINSQ